MKTKNTLQLFSTIILAATVALTACKEKAPKVDTTVKTTTTDKVAYSDSASSSVKVFDQNGRVCIQQSNTYYQMVDLNEGKTKTPLLLKIKKTELCFADSINKDKVYQITATSILDTKKVEWSADFVATEIMFNDNSIMAIREGTEDEDYVTRYSLADGKNIFSCSYGEMKVAIPNVKDKRFVGYTSRKTVTTPIQNLNQENLLGLIKYSSSTKSINTVKIFLKRSKVSGKIPTYTPDMFLVANNSNTMVIDNGKGLVLMKTDQNYTSKDVTDFQVKYTLFYGDDNESTDIIIPVVNDNFDLSKAKFDKELFDLVGL